MYEWNFQRFKIFFCSLLPICPAVARLLHPPWWPHSRSSSSSSSRSITRWPHQYLVLVRHRSQRPRGPRQRSQRSPPLWIRPKWCSNNWCNRCCNDKPMLGENAWIFREFSLNFRKKSCKNWCTRCCNTSLCLARIPEFFEIFRLISKKILAKMMRQQLMQQMLQQQAYAWWDSLNFSASFSKKIWLKSVYFFLGNSTEYRSQGISWIDYYK